MRYEESPAASPTRRRSVKLREFCALRRPAVMAILNATPDSFSDPGRFAEPNATTFEPDILAILDAAKEAVRQGAAILDVGGESTKPGAEPIDEAQELRRVVPVVRALAKALDAPISVDTYRPAVADAALQEGASIVNDVAAGRFCAAKNCIVDDTETNDLGEMPEVAARHGADVVLMHMKGTPKTMQAKTPRYPHGVVDDVLDFLTRRRDAFINAGVAPERLAFDPGLGFGKTFEQNWILVREAERFRALGGPLLYGFSRKRFLRETARQSQDGTETNEDAFPDRETLDFMTATLAALLANRNVDILRVHNVRKTALALRLAQLSAHIKEDAS